MKEMLQVKGAIKKKPRRHSAYHRKSLVAPERSLYQKKRKSDPSNLHRWRWRRGQQSGDP